jgi:hypothetical protein
LPWLGFWWEARKRSAGRLCWIKKAIVFAGGKLLHYDHYLYLIAMTARRVWRTSGEIGEIGSIGRVLCVVVRITGGQMVKRVPRVVHT